MGARAEVGGRETRAAAMQSSETAQSRAAAGGGAPSAAIHERRAERLTHGAKVKRGQLSAVQQGRYGTGPAPYGYRRGRDGENPLEVDDAEAEVVRMIFREYLNTRSTGKVVEYLQSKGIATRKGNRWSRQAIPKCELLKRPTTPHGIAQGSPPIGKFARIGHARPPRAKWFDGQTERRDCPLCPPRLIRGHLLEIKSSEPLIG